MGSAAGPARLPGGLGGRASPRPHRFLTVSCRACASRARARSATGRHPSRGESDGRGRTTGWHWRCFAERHRRRPHRRRSHHRQPRLSSATIGAVRSTAPPLSGVGAAAVAGIGCSGGSGEASAATGGGSTSIGSGSGAGPDRDGGGDRLLDGHDGAACQQRRPRARVAADLVLAELLGLVHRPVGGRDELLGGAAVLRMRDEADAHAGDRLAAALRAAPTSSAPMRIFSATKNAPTMSVSGRSTTNSSPP